MGWPSAGVQPPASEGLGENPTAGKVPTHGVPGQVPLGQISELLKMCTDSVSLSLMHCV